MGPGNKIWRYRSKKMTVQGKTWAKTESQIDRQTYRKSDKRKTNEQNDRKKKNRPQKGEDKLRLIMLEVEKGEVINALRSLASGDLSEPFSISTKVALPLFRVRNGEVTYFYAVLTFSRFFFWSAPCFLLLPIAI